MNSIYEQQIRKIFPDCKVELLEYGGVEVTFCFGSESTKEFISPEVLCQENNEDILKQIKLSIENRIEMHIIRKFLKKNKKTSKYIVSHYIDVNKVLIHPEKYVEIQRGLC